MKIQVQLDDGQMVEIKAKSSETLRVVKESIQAQFGVPPERQKLWFGGTELLEAQTLAHSLWEALRKVGNEDDSGRLDLQMVKRLCSPMNSPRRGLSPVRSDANMSLLDVNKSSDSRATLEGAAEKLRGGRPSSPRPDPARMVEEYHKTLAEDDHDHDMEQEGERLRPGDPGFKYDDSMVL